MGGVRCDTSRAGGSGLLGRLRLKGGVKGVEVGESPDWVERGALLCELEGT